MTAEKYLSQIQRLESQIRFKLEDIERLKDLASGISGMGDGERVQTSKRYDKMGDAVANLVDCQREAEEW